jgi:hypothetical protein
MLGDLVVVVAKLLRRAVDGRRDHLGGVVDVDVDEENLVGEQDAKLVGITFSFQLERCAHRRVEHLQDLFALPPMSMVVPLGRRTDTVGLRTPAASAALKARTMW